MACRDPQIAGLLDKFVCVRMVYANDMDLSLFQFDYDLTWAVFFLNADKTLYGRYGTGTYFRNGTPDTTLEGLRKSMEGALELHKNYPANKASLAGKTGPAPKHPTPQAYPEYKAQFPPTLQKNRTGCMHCHMPFDAERKAFRAARQPIPDQWLWTYPLPSALGMDFDPREKASVRSVTAQSPAAKAGLKGGDRITSAQGQPIISVADVQWVLHNAPEPSQVKLEVERGGKKSELLLELAAGWRRKGDFHKGTIWYMRPGIICEEAAPAARAGLPAQALALNIKSLPGYGGPHAKQAGLQAGDLIISIDGLTERMGECEFLAYIHQKKNPGEKLELVILRSGQKKSIQLTLP